MMSLREERLRQSDLLRAVEAIDDRPPGGEWLVGQVYTASTIPTCSGCVYLVHPVTVGGAETEGGAGTLAVDATRSVPVVVLNSAPAVGDYLIARSAGGRWVSDGLAGDGFPFCIAPDCFQIADDSWCGNCNDPAQDFDVVFDVAVGGSTTWTLTTRLRSGECKLTIFAPGVSPPPVVAAFSWVGLAVNIPLVGGLPGTKISVGYGLGPTTDVQARVIVSYPARMTQCDPLFVSFAPPSTNPFYWLGVRLITITGRRPAVPADCYPLFTVGGVGGAHVDMWNDSGKTVSYGGGTTSSPGPTRIPMTTLTTDYYYEVSKPPRWATTPGSVTLATPRDGVLASFSPAAGYAVTTPCLSEPLATTLNATHSVFGALTMAYDAVGAHGSGWYATASYSYPGCNCCPASTVTVTCVLDTGGDYKEYWLSS